MDIKKINFTGAQGTGKTTVLNALKADPDFTGFEFVTEVVRNFVKEKGISINKDGTVETQKILFEAYEKSLRQNQSHISDRCIIDVLAYTEEGRKRVLKGTPEEKDFSHCERTQREIVMREKLNLGLVCYFPIEFDIIDDGVRSVDPLYQKSIDKNICNTLRLCEIPHIIVRGTVEERVAAVKRALFGEFSKK